jgi:hypothetical protein
MKKYGSRGQVVLEYAVLVACLVGAFLAMQYYLKRSIEGRAKQAGDEISEPYDSKNMIQSQITTKVDSRVTINSSIGTLTKKSPGDPDQNFIDSNISQYETVTKTGSEHLGTWGDGSLTDDVTPQK